MDITAVRACVLARVKKRESGRERDKLKKKTLAVKTSEIAFKVSRKYLFVYKNGIITSFGNKAVIEKTHRLGAIS